MSLEIFNLDATPVYLVGQRSGFPSVAEREWAYAIGVACVGATVRKPVAIDPVARYQARDEVIAC